MLAMDEHGYCICLTTILSDYVLQYQEKNSSEVKHVNKLVVKEFLKIDFQYNRENVSVSLWN